MGFSSFWGFSSIYTMISSIPPSFSCICRSLPTWLPSRFSFRSTWNPLFCISQINHSIFSLLGPSQ
jgi:hypothetical protein